MTRLWNRLRSRTTLLGLVALVSLFGASQVLSQTSDPPPLEDKVRRIEELDKLPDVVDPTTFAKQIQEHEEAAESARQEYIKWLDEFNRSGIDPRSLHREEIGGLSLPGPASVDEAVGKADAIVSGTVVGVEFEPVPAGPESYARPWTVVRFKIAETIKGNGFGEEVSIVFGGGPMLSPSHSAPVLGYYAVEPLLLEGDSAILLLLETERYPPYAEHYPDSYYPQAWTGVNKIEGGRVQTLEHSAFRSTLEGDVVAEVLQVLAGAVSGN